MDTVTNPKTVEPKRWRDVLPVHPAADDFPVLSETELRELADDIEAHGLREPVALYDDPEVGLCILDGRNRADALELIGKSITDDNEENWTEHVGEDDPDFDPYAFVVSKNIRRRHLKADERQKILIALIARSPEKSNRQLGKEAGVDHKTIGRARAKGEDVGRIPHVDTIIDTQGREQPAHRSPEVEAEAETAPYDPGPEVTLEELLTDPEYFWDDLTHEPRARIMETSRKVLGLRRYEERAECVNALGDLIAAATEMKKFYEDHLLAGRGLQ